MTPNELRALADALDGCNPYRDSSAVYSVAAYLRAQADAQPVAWLRPENRVEEECTARTRISIGERCPPIGTWRPLYTHPAPAASQGDASRMINALQSIRAHVADDPSALAAAIVATCDNALNAAPQAEPIDPHMIVTDDRFPDEQAELKRQPVSEATALIEWPESAKWKNRAAPEGIEHSCMGEPKREPLTVLRILEIEDDANRKWRDNGRIVEYAVVFARMIESDHGIGGSDDE